MTLSLMADTLYVLDRNRPMAYPVRRLLRIHALTSDMSAFFYDQDAVRHLSVKFPTGVEDKGKPDMAEFLFSLKDMLKINPALDEVREQLADNPTCVISDKAKQDIIRHNLSLFEAVTARHEEMELSAPEKLSRLALEGTVFTATELAGLKERFKEKKNKPSLFVLNP